MGWRAFVGLEASLPPLPVSPVPVTNPTLPTIVPPEIDLSYEWTCSDAGIAFIMREEGFRAEAYPDGAGVWTIGYGTTRIDGVPVKKGDVITMPKAIQCLRQDVKVFLTALRRLVVVDLTQNQIDALISFMYNVGGKAFQQSTLRKVINAGDPVVENHFTRWNKIKDPKTGKLVVSNGLTARRKREYRVFVKV